MHNEANLHKLLMPPHPGDTYRASALCSCGDWQYEASTAAMLSMNYRIVMHDHTRHIRNEIERQEWLARNRNA